MLVIMLIIPVTMLCSAGTGKTLVARALAGACSHSSGTPVTLFARKGADCLGKFAGEAERTLRLLFDEVDHHMFTPGNLLLAIHVYIHVQIHVCVQLLSARP